MKKNGFFILLAVAMPLAIGGGIWGGRGWAVAHVQRWSGRSDLGFVTCNHCHLVKLEKMRWAQAHPRHASPAGLAVSPDGQKVYIALDSQDEVIEADASTRQITRRLVVKGGPFGMAIDSKGERLYVTCRHDDKVVAIDTRTFKEVESIDVGADPVAIAFCHTKAGDRLVVANSISDNISVLSTAPLKEVDRPQAGREPYAVSVSPDGSVAFVANRLAVPEHYYTVADSELTLLDPARGRLIWRSPLNSSHLAEGVATVPGRDWALVPMVKVHNLVPITQVANGWVMCSGVAISDPQGRIIQMPLDEANDYFADPSGIAVDSNGKRAYIASGGADFITVLDLDKMANWLAKATDKEKAQAIEDLALSAEYVIARIPTGRNPRQIALSPDGARLYVAERLDDSVLVLDNAGLKPLGKIVLGDGGMNDPIRRGERVFTNAKHTFQRQFSCRSCHPDGHVDGLSYDFDGDGIGDNMLDNRSLQGVAGTEPLKWIGKNPTFQIQCGPRFARVLMRTQPIPPADLEDLTAFITALPPPRWERKHNQPLTAEQKRGKQLFFATMTSAGKPIPRERQCHTCHRPPLYTNRLLSSVGTKARTDNTDMFDTPHLLGISQTAPYLHDGRAKTLEELWTTYQTNDLHGVSSYMNKHQLNDLVEFLKTL